MPPHRLTVAKSFNKKVHVHLWVETQYEKAQFKQLFISIIFSITNIKRHQTSATARRCNREQSYALATTANADQTESLFPLG